MYPRIYVRFARNNKQQQQVVTDDYARRLEDGRAAAYISLSQSFAALTGYAGDGTPAGGFTPCPLANVSICPALQEGKPVLVLLSNPLGQTLDSLGVRLAAGFPPGVASYRVLDDKGNNVTAQIVPLSPRDLELQNLYFNSVSNCCNTSLLLCYLN